MLTVACKLKTFTLDFTLLITDYILFQFEKYKRLYTNNAIFALIFNLGQNKIDKYYNFTNKTLVYFAALILHLSCKQKYIKKNWRADQIWPKKEKVRDFQEKVYKLTSFMLSAIPASLETTSAECAKNEFFEWLKDDNKGNSIEDKYP